MADSAEAIVVLQGIPLLLEDPFDVLTEGDLGDLASQLGLLVGGLGGLGRDCLVDKLVLECRGVQLADKVALLDLTSIGPERNDGCTALDLAAG